MAAVMLSSSRQVTRNCSLSLAYFTKYKARLPLVRCCSSLPGITPREKQTRTARGERGVFSCLRSPLVQLRDFHLSTTRGDDFHVIKTPGFPESISEGDIRWNKEVGDFVKEDESVGEIETDKTSIAILAPVSGVIEEMMVEDGATVVADQPLLRLNTSASAAAGSPSAPAVTETPPDVTPVTPSVTPAVPSATPIPTAPPPVPALPTRPLTSVPAASVSVTPAVATPTGSRGETRVKMNRMRLRIGQRLKEAQTTCAMLTTFNEIDMSAVMELRTVNKVEFERRHGVKLGFMSAFVRSASYALERQPVVNAVIDDADIVYRDYVDISVAVATPKGLVVPVLRNTEKMDYADIEKALSEMGEKAKSGNLAIEDMDGGTFTISNGGVFGSLFGTPIINPPQSAILGMHGIFDRPVAINGKVEVRPMMYVALTYDHRLIDGREAVMFLRSIKRTVEDPRTLLLQL